MTRLSSGDHLSFLFPTVQDSLIKKTANSPLGAFAPCFFFNLSRFAENVAKAGVPRFPVRAMVQLQQGELPASFPYLLITRIMRSLFGFRFSHFLH